MPAPALDHPQLLRGLPAADYHAMKAISASTAWCLSEECPALALWRSPWNPDWQPPETAEFDLGIAAHLAALEPKQLEHRTVSIDAADYRTTKARELRDAARQDGKVPLLPWQMDIISAMAASLKAHPIASHAFRNGDAEVTMTWTDPVTRIRCKARVDYLPNCGRWLVDLKTSTSANPRHFADQVARLGYHARAAWYLDGAAEVLGRMPQEYWFIIVAKEPPYLVSVVTLDETTIDWGRRQNRRALDLSRSAMAAGDWPGYRDPGQNRDRAFRIGLPPWAVWRLQDRSDAGEFGAAPTISTRAHPDARSYEG